MNTPKKSYSRYSLDCRYDKNFLVENSIKRHYLLIEFYVKFVLHKLYWYILVHMKKHKGCLKVQWVHSDAMN